MKKSLIFLTIFILSACASGQAPLLLEPPDRPRRIYKTPEKETVPDKPNEKNKKYYVGGEYLYPDPTLGFIENQAWPYQPQVWWITEEGKVPLFPSTLSNTPPRLSIGQIDELTLMPGKHTFYIERWQFLPHYGGWQKLPKTEIVRVKIAAGVQHGRWRGHYGWGLIIYPNRTRVYK